uniref:Uncharacterized protein n=1 Tax=Hyaloperonospora arabidopsidis (strain Emoy2) TaxID=559515 RepID=M4B2V4_HYAAE
MDRETIMLKRQGCAFRKRATGREDVTKGVRPSGNRDPQSQSRRRPLSESRTRSITRRPGFSSVILVPSLIDLGPSLVDLVHHRPRSFIGRPRPLKIRLLLTSPIKRLSMRQG